MLNCDDNAIDFSLKELLSDNDVVIRWMMVLEEYYDVIDVAKAIGSFSKSGILL